MGLVIKVDDTHIMEHFSHNHDGLRGLHDLEIALVSGSNLRRAASDTAFGERPILRTSSGTLEGFELFFLELLGPGSHGRHLSIRRVGDQGSPVVPDSVIVPLGAVVACLAVYAGEAGLQTLHVRPNCPK